MTDKLDGEWKEMSFLMSGMFNKSRTNENPEEPVEKPTKRDDNDYDTLVRTLQFDLKSRPTEKLKTPEQLEAERVEAEREAEQQLMLRMKTPMDADESAKHTLSKDKRSLYRSPDDMDFDDFYPELKKEAVEGMKTSESVEDEKEDVESDEDESGSEDETESDTETTSQKKISNDWAEEFVSKRASLHAKLLSVQDFRAYTSELIKRLNPGLDEQNKERLLLLCTHLISVYREQATSTNLNAEMLDFVSRSLFTICKNNLKEKSIVVFIDLINDLNKQFSSLKKSKRLMPKLDTVCRRASILTASPTLTLRLDIDSTLQAHRYHIPNVGLLPQGHNAGVHTDVSLLGRGGPSSSKLFFCR